MSNKNIVTGFRIPEATTVMEQYARYLAVGGDINSLEKPNTPLQCFIYVMCLNKAGIEIIMNPYYKAIVNTDSAAYNFIGGFYDLGENKKTTNAKIKFRFTLRNTGTDTPKAIGLALLADNEPSQFVGNQYNLQIPNKIQNPEFDKEYTLEGDYVAVNAEKNLNAYRFIRPYIRIDKTKQDKASTHGIDIHEILLTIDDKDYDITSSTRVFSPVQNGASKVELIGGAETENKAEENTPAKEYVRALLNSNAGAQNYLSVIHDQGETERATTGKVKFRFTLEETGTDKPSSIAIRVFANNSAERENINFTDDYNLIFNNKVAEGSVEYNKEYTIEAELPEEVTIEPSKAVKRLDQFRYIKPFIMLNKTTQELTSTHGIIVHEATIEIKGKSIDLLKTAQDFSPVPEGKSKVEIVKEEVGSDRKSDKPHEGETSAHLGDSQTYGFDPNNGGKQLPNPWPEQLKALCGLANAINYGISSSTVSTKNSDPSWNSFRNPMCLRYKDMDGKAKLITFMAGTNDHTQNVPLGEKNISNKNTDTFYGALNVTFEGLKSKYPDGRIIVIPMMYYKNYTNGNGNTIDEFRDVTIELAKHYGLEVYDIQKDLSFNVKENKNATENMPDLVHKNQKGANEFAGLAADFINGKK